MEGCAGCRSPEEKNEGELLLAIGVPEAKKIPK